MSIGGIADAAFPRGPCHGIMTASTLHALLSWFHRVFSRIIFQVFDAYGTFFAMYQVYAVTSRSNLRE